MNGIFYTNDYKNIRSQTTVHIMTRYGKTVLIKLFKFRGYTYKVLNYYTQRETPFHFMSSLLFSIPIF